MQLHISNQGLKLPSLLLLGGPLQLSKWKINSEDSSESILSASFPIFLCYEILHLELEHFEL